MSTGITRDDWLKALGEAVEPPDQQALTTTEFASMIGLGRTAARERLRRLVEQGKAVRTSKIVRAGSAATRCTAYKLVKGKR